MDTAPFQPLKLATWRPNWLDALWPGQTQPVPQPKLWVWLVGVVWLAVQAVARYQIDALKARWMLPVFVALSYGVILLAMTRAHGWIRPTKQGLIVQIAGIVGFLSFWYLGRIDAFYRFWGHLQPGFGSWAPVVPFAYFAVCGVLFRTTIPIVAAKLAGLRLRDLGLATPWRPPAFATMRGTGWMYAVLYAGVFPFVWWTAGTAVFQAKYPLARELVAPDGGLSVTHFVVYQSFYSLVFLSGESLWRGLLTFSLARTHGCYAILLMLVPYSITHYGKPLSETLGSLVAGTLLGFLALRHGTVWSGVVLHHGVALTMDLLAVGRGPAWFRWP
jgi:hypothetical protein